MCCINYIKRQDETLRLSHSFAGLYGAIINTMIWHQLLKGCYNLRINNKLQDHMKTALITG